jgi:hypothetical protein
MKIWSWIKETKKIWSRIKKLKKIWMIRLVILWCANLHHMMSNNIIMLQGGDELYCPEIGELVAVLYNYYPDS